MSRIFYFNITYGCDNNCIFCYSQNTYHGSRTHNEITLRQFKDYLEEKKISQDDRVILNGGEPLLHTQFTDILHYLRDIGCEVLVYTNGTRLASVEFPSLTSRFRFIVPIHGYKELHDAITQHLGSYRETVAGMAACQEDGTCLLDLKVILNAGMVQSGESWERTCSAYDMIPFNHAVHLTKMADTIVSKRNHCPTVDDVIAERYTLLLFEHFLNRGCKIKLYDTCIAGLRNYLPDHIPELPIAPEVFFKDHSQYRTIELKKTPKPCAGSCGCGEFCISAVSQYKVLDFFQGKAYQSLE